MSNLKTVMACCLMLLPLFGKAQNCCDGKDEVMDNEVVRTIMSRRSVRKYLDKPVEHDKLALVAKCGINAPSAMNRQTWVVRVVENPEFIKGTTEIFRKENSEQVKRDSVFCRPARHAGHILRS